MRILFAIAMLFASLFHAEISAAQGLIKYVPPMRGAPQSRIGGGSRGTSDDVAMLQVLAPDHTGLTTEESPVLYWYVSKPASAHFEFTIIDDQEVDPLVDRDLDLKVDAGIQRIRLSDYGVKLKPGIVYRWYVSLVVDPAQRSNDIVASGTIQRIRPSADLQAKLAHAGESGKPAIYANEGIWYDAIDSLSRLVDAAPANRSLREERASLLEEVGLREPAAADRRLEK
ncbi:MAG: DUF928 domain-containing protein [Burkholderiales bacterium]|nr:DUF928 domain-containing protein [Burkholderiales bacterium]